METYKPRKCRAHPHHGLNRTMQYGNFCLASAIASPLQRFKSYYVVWKPPRIDGCPLRKCEFKSYYVVWKLCESKISFDDSSLFKSYYVVWKRIAYFIAGLCFAQFKSYYVVWKRFFTTNLESAEPSLNRTMQYGNEEYIHEEKAYQVV